MEVLQVAMTVDEAGQNGFLLASITRASAGMETSPLLPTACNLPPRITMTQFSTGDRPVPSISLPPCTTSASSAIFSFPSRRSSYLDRINHNGDRIVKGKC